MVPHHIDTPTNLLRTGWLNQQTHIVPGFSKGCRRQALQLGNHLGFHILIFSLANRLRIPELGSPVSNPLQEEAMF